MSARSFFRLGYRREKSEVADLHLLAAGSYNKGAERERSFKLDALRGFAVLLMIGFHLLIDLRDFSVFPSPQIVSIPKWFWRFIPEGIGLLFYLTAGAAAWFRFQCSTGAYSSFAKSGSKLAILAAFISLATAMATPRFAVYFGTLHCLSLSMFLISPCLRFVGPLVPMGIALAGTGIYLNQLPVDSGWLLWFGLAARTGTGGDWYPLLPWFGVILIGAGLAKSSLSEFLKSPVRSSKFKSAYSPLAWMGRHALLIYFSHQIVLLAVLTAFGVTRLN